MKDRLTKHELRQSIRRRRAALTSKQLIQARNNLANIARASNRILRARHILSYSPFAGEISPSRLVDNIAYKTVFYPRITNFRLSQMRFTRRKRSVLLINTALKSLRLYPLPRPQTRLICYWFRWWPSIAPAPALAWARVIMIEL